LISDRWNRQVALGVVAFMFLVGGAFSLWGARYLERDTTAVEAMTVP
jgi:hypothetical protein